MEVRCTVCGKTYEITKLHKDYLRLAQNPQSPFICNNCVNVVRYQSQESSRPKKPI